jgi:hypothetical protein
VDYWLGHIYFNSGNLLNTFKLWKKYIENADKAFDATLKKIEKIRIFLKQYEFLINSINDFKKNLQFVKRYTINKSYKAKRDNSNALSSGISDGRDRSLSDIDSNKFVQNTRSSHYNRINYVGNKYNIVYQGNSPNNTKFLHKGSTHETNNTTNNNRLNYYFDSLQSIKEIEPNLNQNKCIIYEFYKACSIFYVESKN